MHCRKFNSIEAPDVYLISKMSAVVGNVMCCLIAMILTRGFSNCNAEFKYVYLIHSVILSEVLVFPRDLSPYRIWEIRLMKGVSYSTC